MIRIKAFRANRQDENRSTYSLIILTNEKTRLVLSMNLHYAVQTDTQRHGFMNILHQEKGNNIIRILIELVMI